MKYDFEQAKQKVAERNGYESWDEYEYANFMKTGDTHSIWEEVFQMGCNEAVKADRDRIVEFGKPVDEDSEYAIMMQEDGFNDNGTKNFLAVINENFIKSLPLPFPEA